MKLSTAINKAPKVFVYVPIGDGETHLLQVSKKKAKEIAGTWLNADKDDKYWCSEDGIIVATILDGRDTGNVYLG